ncbi:MAG: MFS transporter [Spirochaetales bacterium]
MKPETQRYNSATHLSLLIGGQMVSTLGNSLYLIVVVLYLVDLTDNAALVGTYHFLTFLPGFILAPIAGAIADMVSRKKLIVGSDIARGLVMVTTGLLIIFRGMDAVAVVLVATVLVGSANTLFFPAVNAIVPDIVTNPDRLRPANSLRGSLVQLANLSGNAIGGTIYTVLGAPITFIINGAGYLVSAFQELFIRVSPELTGAIATDSPRLGTGAGARLRAALDRSLNDIRTGLQFSFGRRNLRTIILLQFVANLLYPPIVVALPFILRDVIGVSEAYFGYMLAATLGGGIVGYVIMATADIDGPREIVIFRGAYVCLALGLFAASSLSIPVMFAALPLCGAGVSVAHVSSMTVLQRAVPYERRGRVFAFLEMATHLAAPLSYGLSGVGVELLRGRLWMLFPAIAAAATVLAITVSIDRALPSLFISGSISGE